MRAGKEEGVVMIISKDTSIERVYLEMRDLFFDFYCWDPVFKTKIDSGETLKISKSSDSYICEASDGKLKIPYDKHKFGMPIYELGITLNKIETIWCTQMMLSNVKDYLKVLYGIYISKDEKELAVLDICGFYNTKIRVKGLVRNLKQEGKWIQGLKMPSVITDCMYHLDDIDFDKAGEIIYGTERIFSDVADMLIVPLAFRILPAPTMDAYNWIYRYVYGGGNKKVDGEIETLINSLGGLRLYPVGEIVWSFRGDHTSGRVNKINKNSDEYRLVVG